MAILILIIIALVLGGIGWYKVLPALNIHSTGVWIFALLVLIVVAMIYTLVRAIKKKKSNKIANCLWGAVGVVLVLFIILLISSSTIFRSKTYANRISVEEGEFKEDIPVVDDIKNIPLMDTKSAKKLGNRVVGSLTDVVSQYDVSDEYTTICYKGEVRKIAALEYAGFFKYFNNKSKGIPGYVIVNPRNNEAEFVRLDKGIQYSPSAYFSRNLKRKLRTTYLTKIFGNYTFQIDDEGNPYWVVTCEEPNTFFSAYSPKEVILLNAVTGESKIYKIEDAPEWVDYVYDGDTVEELYDSYGTLSNGYFNSLFAQKGCKETTDDYGYLIQDDDVYVYTGVTSTTSDESNLGFILVNSRTGKFKYYAMSGAEEYSAMSAAEGVVQNYGYNASFPSLINMDGEATYVMVLKDNNGLVKLYAMVNVKNYTIVSTGETLNEALKNYKTALVSAGKKVDLHNVNSDSVETKEIKITDIKFLTVEGETVCYIKSEDGKCFKQKFEDNEKLILLNVNDTVEISYDKESRKDDIIDILDLKNKNS